MAKKKPPVEEHDPLDDLSLESTLVDTDLDPHLQDILIAAKSNENRDRSSVTGIAEDGTTIVDIIAKVHDPTVAVPGLEAVRVIGQIVTGTVRVEDIEAVRKDPNVVSLKRATILHADLQFSVPEIDASQEQLAQQLPAGSPHDGRGVIVGVVDYDCDFVHQNFRRADGTTRLLFLWDQQGPATSVSPLGYGYGREFDTDTINKALAAAAPTAAEQSERPQLAYQALAYQPRPNAHGTHVLDIAAGNGRATGNRGVAPGADLIFVHAAAGDFEPDESFGNSRRLLEGVDYIFEKAAALGRAAVVNLSLGTHGGPHDGSTLVEQGFDTLLDQPGRAIVIAAGNSRNKQSHASGQITATQPRLLQWEISPGDQTGNEMEVWYGGAQELHVTLVSPAGTRLGPVALGATQIINRLGQPVGRIIHRRSDPNNGDNQIDLLLDPTLPTGVWQVELKTAGSDAVSFHAWIERDDYGQSRFSVQDNDPTHTVGSISCGAQTVVVGSYNATVPARDLAASSGEGPTRDGKQKPEVSAPGISINAAKSLTQKTTRMSGTSMAAPHVTGQLALLFQMAGPDMAIADFRRTLASTARRPGTSSVQWHGQYGQGRISVLAALLTQLTPVAPAQPLSMIAGGTSEAPLLPVTLGSNGTALFSLIEILTRAASTQKSRVRLQIEVEPLPL